MCTQTGPSILKIRTLSIGESGFQYLSPRPGPQHSEARLEYQKSFPLILLLIIIIHYTYIQLCITLSTYLGTPTSPVYPERCVRAVARLAGPGEAGRRGQPRVRRGVRRTRGRQA